MPRTLAQWVGIVVTTIVVAGARHDIALAVALAVPAGGLASFCVARDAARRAVVPENAAPRQ
jgi:hypothetical protein